ncbi:4445_t:CDS:2 [Entrophospora sp. SA101]|nr:4445_t:CDS:2 [Entrophospora sp. SA101]
MANTQSKVDELKTRDSVSSLEEQNSKLVAEITELKREKAEFLAKEAEQKDEEKTIHMAKIDDEIKEIKKSSINSTLTETENPNVTPEQTQNKNVPESDISNDTSNSDESNNSFSELSENVDQETETLVPLESNKSQCSTSPIYTESKSLEDKEIFDFLVRVDKEEVEQGLICELSKLIDEKGHI